MIKLDIVFSMPELSIHIFYTILIILAFYIFYRNISVVKIEKCIHKEPLDINRDIISIIIPVRNEEENIKKVIHNLCGGDYELIIIDDESTDNTYYIAKKECEKCNCQVFKSHKPDKWMGKNYACYTGFLKSNGKYLLFVDSDTVIQPTDINCLINALHDYDIVSGLLRIKCKNVLCGIIEYAFTSLTRLFYPPWKFTDIRKTWLAGSIIGWRKQVYVTVGEHKIVYDKILEDVKLAREALSKGFSIGFIRGGKWKTIWKPSYTDVKNLLKRIIATEKIKKKDILSVLLISFIFNISLFLAPLLYITKVLSLYMLIILCGVVWITPLYLNLSRQVETGVIEFLLYPLGYIILTWIMYKIVLEIENGNYILYWRGREISIK